MSTQTSPAGNNTGNIFGKIWRGLKGYLTDRRNLLGHALVGILFLALAIWVPIPGWIKLIVIACLIAFNIVRMRIKVRKVAQTVPVEESEED